jgi:hypothetical protein
MWPGFGFTKKWIEHLNKIEKNGFTTTRQARTSFKDCVTATRFW